MEDGAIHQFISNTSKGAYKMAMDELDDEEAARLIDRVAYAQAKQFYEKVCERCLL